MQVAIIDYGSGNLHSARKSLERAAYEHSIDCDIVVTCDPEVVDKSDRIILPGVGAFADCRAGLYAVPGLISALEERVLRQGRPFLGICVGMQLMATLGREHETSLGLNWIAGEVTSIRPKIDTLKVPHMGWNTLNPIYPHIIFANLTLGENGKHAYFVHSYQFLPKHHTNLLATTHYGEPISAIIGRDNLIGTQFHPEKSQLLGMQFFANFLRWKP